MKSLRKETGPMLVKKLRMKPLKKTNLGVTYAVLILAPLGDQSGHGSGYI